ncbi:hypothetical protein HF086_003516 [Spodoptera exigua]|uniref:Sensory neuron membrane protein 1 n=1 Tax=Spodoptera exigua TaxID=7107 RepID=A0A922MPJ0_SPOEX|nr:hypothetical protein HF086_003516 [Spodoptera exigua]
MLLPKELKYAAIAGGVALFGLIFGWVLFPTILKSQLKKEMALSKKTDVRQMWEKIPFPLDFKVYIFNYTNAEEVAKGAVPILKEIGPYHFDEWKEKVEVEDHEEDDTITYKKRDVFYFNPELSGPGLTGEETVVIPHVFMLNVMDVGQVTAVDGQTVQTIWKDHCNEYQGTDGTIFPPFLTENDRLQSFSTDLCRSFKPWFQKKSSYKGIKTNRYVANIGNLAEDPELQCFCPQPDKCPPKGLMDLAPCIKAPMYASMPHFLDCDPALLSKVKGLNPDVNAHGIEIDFEPGLALNKSFVNMLKHQLFIPKRVVGVLRWWMVSFGSLGALIGVVFHFRGKKVNHIMRLAVSGDSKVSKVTPEEGEEQKDISVIGPAQEPAKINI